MQTVDQSPPAVTFNPETAKAEMQLALSKEGLAYQKLLQECENITFSKDTINEERAPLKNLRLVKTKLEKLDNPYTPAWKAWNEAKKSLFDPVVTTLTKKENEYRAIVKQIEADNARIEAENKRVRDIKVLIDTFILDQSQAIAAATTPEALVGVEKLIGSHKANKTRYQEFLPELVTKSETLTPLIKTQKEAIKKLEELAKAQKVAEKSGDDQAVLDIMEQREGITAAVEETKITVQETAINSTISSAPIIPEGVKMGAPKARRTAWKAEIVDKELAIKKSIHLLDVTLNAGKIADSIKTLKENKVFDGKTEHIINGIRYYEEKLY